MKKRTSVRHIGDKEGDRLVFKTPKNVLPFTGERYVTGLSGTIQHEHYHRYLFASQFCNGRDILDIACGEGYGSALLGQVARSVVGADIDASVVAFAQREYASKHVRFVESDATEIALEANSVDVVISFETIEHFSEQERFLQEVERVMRPGGILIISSPNRSVYSGEDGNRNEFHVRELDQDEFLALLSKNFSHVELLDQRVICGSILVAEGDQPRLMEGLDSSDGKSFDRAIGLASARYFVAVASASPLPSIVHSVFNDGAYLDHLNSDLNALAHEIGVRDAEIVRLNTVLKDQATQMRTEINRLTWDHDADLASDLYEISRRLSAELGLKAVAEDGSLRLSEAVRLLREVCHARDLLAEKQVGYESSTKLLGQLVCDLRATIERLESENTVLRQEARLSREERIVLANRRVALEADLDQLRKEIVERDEKWRKLEEQTAQALRAANALDPLHKAIRAYCLECDFLQAQLAFAHADRSYLVDRPGDIQGRDSVVRETAYLTALPVERYSLWRPFRRKGASPRFDAAVEKGDAARDAQAFGEAAQFYRQALEERPDAAPIWVQCGNMLKDSGDRAGAVEAYRRALALAPGVADTRMQLGHALKLHGDAQASLAAYEDAFRLDPTIEGVQREMGEIAHHVERLSLSQERIDLLESANSARDEGDWRAAAERFGRLLRQAPRLGTVWVQYGHALKEIGHPRAAAQAYRTAIELRPLAADPHLQLGHALKLIGDPPGARAAYAKALELEPGSQSALRELTELGAEEAKTPEDEAPDQHRLDTDDLMILKGSEIDSTDVEAHDSPPETKSKYSLPQGLSNLVVDLYGEEHVPFVSCLMGLIDRFGDNPSEFAASFERTLLLDHIKAAAARAETTVVSASIIVPAHESLVRTLTCIASILEHTRHISFEIIVSDNPPMNETLALSNVGGCIKVVRHETDFGFIDRCNAAAATAKGDFIVLLNSRALVLPDWLDALIDTFKTYPETGLVGSKLLRGDGTLKEAGGIIWRDGSTCSFGYGCDPTLPEFNYAKETDYCSSGAIAVPRSIWCGLGGYDPSLSPASCEDADLAFRVREAGNQTRYQPCSTLIYHDDSNLTTYRAFSQRKLFDRWKNTLRIDHFPGDESILVARDRTRDKPHILVIDHAIPQRDRDAGSKTLYLYIKLFRDFGFQVILWPDNLQEDRDYIRGFQELGIEVIYSSAYRGRFAEWFKANAAWIDYAFVSRPHIAAQYVEEISNGKTKIVYYGHDLHFRRLLKEYEVSKKKSLLEQAESDKALEEKAWTYSDVILYPSKEECAEVRAFVSHDKAVVEFPITFFPDSLLRSSAIKLHSMSQASAHRMMFVGGFSHTPNVDGIIWFVHEVMPILRLRDPRYVLCIAGSNMPPSVIELASSDIELLGRIDDDQLRELYETSGLVIIPLRFGAGVKGKLIEAFAHGVPVVSTSVGVQGIHQADAMTYVADKPTAFADAIIQSFQETVVTLEKAKRALAFIRQDYSKEAAIRALSPHIEELRTQFCEA